MDTLTGKSLDEVLKNAANIKNVNIENIKYTVTEEKTGIFGIGNKITISYFCENDIKEFIINYLSKYFNGIQMETKVDVNLDGHFFNVNLDSDNNAILIGKNGQTLQAINTLLKSAVSGYFKCRISLLVDINSYKKDKYDKEVYFATKIAHNVLRSKTDALLDPMPNDERKAIHAALSNIKGIKTISEGEGSQRRLKICYANKEN